MQFNDICRVCSNRGEYSIFSPIPSYLHASTNEFLHWQKDISTLLEETSGLVVVPGDGLPEKMCALCISYLKHAATFRQQLIDNTLSLKAAQQFLIMNNDNEMTDKMKDIIDSDEPKQITEESLNFRTTRKTDAISYINNMLNNPNKVDEYRKRVMTSDQNNKETDDNNMEMYLLSLFNKETNRGCKSKKSTSARRLNNQKNYSANNFIQIDDDDNEDCQNNSSSGDDELMEQQHQQQLMELQKEVSNNKNIFNYKEKIFEEDDIMDLDILKETNIIINIPTNCKERKCRACYRRFMTEETFDEHTRSCLELKFLRLIEDINRLLDIRRSKTISPHEFIRRMIFSLKKTYQWLKKIDTNTESSHTINSNQKDDTTVNVNSLNNQNNSKIAYESKNLIINKTLSDQQFCNKLPPKEENQRATTNSMQKQKNPINDDNTLLQLLREKFENEQKLTKSVQHRDNADKLNAINSYSIFEQNMKVLSSDSHCDDVKIPARTIERINHQQNLNPTNSSTPISNMKIKFSAVCNACEIIFNSVDSLEQHNLKYHNKNNNSCSSKYEQHRNIIDLFEGNSNNIEGTVDVMNILNLE